MSFVLNLILIILAVCFIAAQLWLVAVMGPRALNGRTLLRLIRERNVDGVRALLVDESVKLDERIRHRGWLWLAVVTDDAEAWRIARGD